MVNPQDLSDRDSKMKVLDAEARIFLVSTAATHSALKLTRLFILLQFENFLTDGE